MLPESMVYQSELLILEFLTWVTEMMMMWIVGRNPESLDHVPMARVSLCCWLLETYRHKLGFIAHYCVFDQYLTETC